jgi:phosphatidylserine decarboxylase
MAWFANRFGINLDEAEKPFESYDCLQALFTRRLKDGVRIVDDSPDILVSPVDARVGAFGRIESGRLIQAKGLDYSAEALLGDAVLASAFQDGSFATLYLSPKDYHRIHTPCAGRVIRTIYEPGTLWPVNEQAVANVPQLFAVNERVTSILETEHGLVACCMVGATNVGSIRLAYRDLVTNRGGARDDTREPQPPSLDRGAHLATFELGSTVVLLVANPSWQFSGLESGRWEPLGRAICTLDGSSV